MRYLRFGLILSMLFCSAIIFAGGQQDDGGGSPGSGAESNEQQSFSFTDSSGREITVPGPVESIVYSHRSIGEALRIVDAWDRVVGIDGFTADEILYPNVNELPDIAPPMNPYEINYEKVFELDPDVLITFYMPMPGFEEMVSKLEPEIKVIALNVGDPDEIRDNISNLGILLGREAEAEEFIAFYDGIEAELSAVTSKTAPEDRPRMLYKTGFGEPAEIMTYNDKTSGFPYRCELTGCINVAADLPSQSGWVQSVDPEWLVQENPDVVIVSGFLPGLLGIDVDDTAAAAAYRREVMELDAFAAGDAVRTDEVYMLSADFYHSTRSIISFAYMAKWFYPEEFRNLDPNELHQEYLSRFMRIDYNLSEHGVFVYPES